MAEEAIDPEALAGFAEHMAKIGIDRADARLALELGVHAAGEAAEAIVRVSKTAPPHLQKLVAAIATVGFSQSGAKIGLHKLGMAAIIAARGPQ